MQHLICLIPGRSDFYEVVAMRKKGSNLLVDTYNLVGPPSTSRQRQAWEQTLASHLPKGSDIKMVSVMPFPLAPVSPKMKKVDSSSADFNLGGQQEARENAALMPTLRRQGKKYGYESLPIEMADVGEHGGGGMVQAILYVIFGGRYYGGYIFRPGSPKVIRVSMLDALEKVKGKDKALLIHRLVKQMGPLAYGAKLTQVRQEIPALDDDEYEYRLDEWYEGGQMGPEPVRGSRSFQFPMMMYEGDFDDRMDMEQLYALFQYAEIPNIQEAMPALLQRTVGWAEKCRRYPAGSNDQMRCAARQLMIGWGEDHTVQSMLGRLTPKERHRYAKVLLSTLSRDKALKAVFPNLKGKAKAIRSFVEDFYVADGLTARELKDMVNYGPPVASLRGSDKTWWSWQTAEEAGLTPEEVIAEQRRGSIRQAIQRRRKVGSHVLRAPTAVELRNLIFQKRYDSSQIDRLYDAIMMVRENMQFFPETREGVLYVNHVAERNWPQVLKDHDGISAMADRFQERRWEAQSQAEAKHLASTRKLTKALPVLPGITPLLTNADFKREADLMKHCILSHSQRPLHHFHIEHPQTGEHSTIQIQKNGHVMQHYGVSDKVVSPTQDAYVQEWLELAFPKKKAKGNPRRYSRTFTRRRRARRNRGVSGAQWQMASKYWPAGYDGLDPDTNRKIIGKWLSNAPSAWRSEFSSGMSERVATGQGGSRAMNVDNALKILGITAGGNISGDTARGRNKVPDSVRFDAMKGLALSWTHDYGGWNFIGVARAIQLAIMPGVPNETMNRMANFFGRNQKWKKARQFGDDNDPSRGYMAWLNWGGVAAEKWLAG